jgi:hypothetical protein
MLGPGLLMGCIAAREIVAHLKTEGRSPAANIASAAPENLWPQPTDPESLRAWRGAAPTGGGTAAGLSAL